MATNAWVVQMSDLHFEQLSIVGIHITTSCHNGRIDNIPVNVVHSCHTSHKATYVESPFAPSVRNCLRIDICNNGCDRHSRYSQISKNWRNPTEQRVKLLRRGVSQSVVAPETPVVNAPPSRFIAIDPLLSRFSCLCRSKTVQLRP